MATIEQVKTKYEAQIMAKPGVNGFGIGARMANGQLVRPIEKVIIIHVQTEADVAELPTSLDGYPVQVEVVGEIRAC